MQQGKYHLRVVLSSEIVLELCFTGLRTSRCKYCCCGCCHHRGPAAADSGGVQWGGGSPAYYAGRFDTLSVPHAGRMAGPFADGGTWVA
jgi:hypothetical protein